jgi:hypothetical protein
MARTKKLPLAVGYPSYDEMVQPKIGMTERAHLDRLAMPPWPPEQNHGDVQRRDQVLLLWRELAVLTGVTSVDVPTPTGAELDPGGNLGRSFYRACGGLDESHPMSPLVTHYGSSNAAVRAALFALVCLGARWHAAEMQIATDAEATEIYSNVFRRP